MHLLSPEEKILLLASNYSLTPEKLDEFAKLLHQSPDWVRIISASRFHSLAPLLVKHIFEQELQNNLPANSWDRILGIARNHAARRLKLILVFQELSTIFKEQNIDFILLKGLFVSDSYYLNPAFRPMQDIDILVQEINLVRVTRILEELGASRLIELQSGYINSLLQHIPPFIYKEVVIEVHTNLVASNLPYSFTPEALWKNVIEIEIQKTKTLVFNPEFNLVYLCIHLFRHLRTAKFRLIWFTDILQFFSITDSLDHEKIKNLAIETGTEDAIRQVFYFLNSFWDFEINEKSSMSKIESGDRLLQNFHDGILRSQKPDEFSNYEAWRQIPGIFNKLRYLTGIAFPSSAYMKKKYSISSSVLLIPLYPFNALKVFFKGIKLLLFR